MFALSRHLSRWATGLPDVPDVLLVQGRVSRFARLGITLIGEFPVTVDGLEASPSQFSADRGLPVPETPSTR